MDAASHFPPTYAAARRAFRSAADAVGARLDGRAIPARSPRDEELTIDTAYLGPDLPGRVLVLSSGIHGVEGFAGSAIQHAFLTRGWDPDRWAPGVGVLLVHALNPYGFSALRRVNESNVDLNRNFVRHPEGHVANPGYAALRDVINPRELTPETDAACRERLRAHAADHGPSALQDALTRGQYEWAEGVQFGGTREEASARLMREIAVDGTRDAGEVLWLDLHTGLGPSGEVELISEYAPGAPEFERARQWFGPAARSTVGGDSVSVPLCGTIERGIEAALPGRRVTPLAAEFGTVPAARTFWAMRADNWLHRHGDPSSARGRRIRAELLEVFCPADPAWRRQVLEVAREVLRLAAGALAGR